MAIPSIIYFYSLICLSIIASIAIAGLALPSVYHYFEKSNDADTSRIKSLLVALILWMILQTCFCLIVFWLNGQYLA